MSEYTKGQRVWFRSGGVEDPVLLYYEGPGPVAHTVKLRYSDSHQGEQIAAVPRAHVFDVEEEAWKSTAQ